MRRLVLCLILAIVPVQSMAADYSAIETLREGDMKKLTFHKDPEPVSDARFSDLEGGDFGLGDFAGQVTLVNFWATWCAPCRKEMPGLDRVQAKLGGPDFQVVTIATGRNPPVAISRFFDEEQIEGLPTFIDPKQALARDMAVLGLPITVILDRQGNEIARLRGDAEWDSDSAIAILEALIATPDQS